MFSPRTRHIDNVRKRRAYTLVEIMVVVLIIGIISAAASASYSFARDRSRQNACVSNLRQFDQAKEQYAMMYNKNNGDVLLMDDVFPLLLKGTPRTCPSGGTYNLQPVGTPPTCTIAGTYPHVLH